MLTDKKISVIIICYNDGGSVREMYRRVTAAMDAVTPHYEIIYVNENSPDNAEEILRELAAVDRRLMVINHTRNFGGQQAFTTGLQYATGDAALMLDGDLQDPPEMFTSFVEQWLAGYAVVYGVREHRRGNPIRAVCYKLFYRLLDALSDIRMPLDASEFGLIDRRVINAINAMPESNRFIRGLRAWTGFKSIGIPYTRDTRFSGETNYTFLNYITYAKRLIFAFSFKPLEWISYLASAVTALAGIGLIVYLVLALTTDVPRGWATLIIATLFLGAIQLFCLSIIGEYLGRLYQEVKRRPHAIIRDIINGPVSPPADGTHHHHHL